MYMWLHVYNIGTYTLGVAHVDKAYVRKYIVKEVCLIYQPRNTTKFDIIQCLATRLYQSPEHYTYITFIVWLHPNSFQIVLYVYIIKFIVLQYIIEPC